MRQAYIKNSGRGKHQSGCVLPHTTWSRNMKNNAGAHYYHAALTDCGSHVCVLFTSDSWSPWKVWHWRKRRHVLLLCHAAVRRETGHDVNREDNQVLTSAESQEKTDHQARRSHDIRDARTRLCISLDLAWYCFSISDPLKQSRSFYLLKSDFKSP